MLNVYSSRIALTMIVPIDTPTSEITGALAAGTAWRGRTRGGGRPFPPAGGTKPPPEGLGQRRSHHPHGDRRERQPQDEPRQPQRLQPRQRVVGQRLGGGGLGERQGRRRLR